MWHKYGFHQKKIWSEFQKILPSVFNFLQWSIKISSFLPFLISNFISFVYTSNTVLHRTFDNWIIFSSKKFYSWSKILFVCLAFFFFCPSPFLLTSFCLSLCVVRPHTISYSLSSSPSPFFITPFSFSTCLFSVFIFYLNPLISPSPSFSFVLLSFSFFFWFLSFFFRLLSLFFLFLSFLRLYFHFMPKQLVL